MCGVRAHRNGGKHVLTADVSEGSGEKASVKAALLRARRPRPLDNAQGSSQTTFTQTTSRIRRTHAQDMIALCLLLLRFSRYARYCVGRYSSATHAPKGVIKGYRKPENQGGAEGRVQGGHEKSTPMRENIMLRDETGDGGTGDAEDRERACTTGGAAARGQGRTHARRRQNEGRESTTSRI